MLLTKDDPALRAANLALLGRRRDTHRFGSVELLRRVGGSQAPQARELPFERGFAASPKQSRWEPALIAAAGIATIFAVIALWFF